MSDTVVAPKPTFMAFLSLNYYPKGGISDLVGVYPTQDEAIEQLVAAAQRHYDSSPNNIFGGQDAHIWNIETQTTVWEDTDYKPRLPINGTINKSR